MRLISLPLSTGSEPVYIAAVEIKLTPKAITYWRQPGEAGVPPQFSFQGSENVARAEFLFPTPQRLDEDGAVAMSVAATAIHFDPQGLMSGIFEQCH